MSRDIKRLKPSNSRYKQGYINPESCTKLFESQRNKPIIYRSSYEKDFIQWLEKCPAVTRWGSECLQIPYVNLSDGTTHYYYPDYIVEKDGSIYVIEVKPLNQTNPPKPGLPKDSYAWKEYIRNVSKWKTAKKFCEDHDFHFKILTENTIKRL